MSEDSKDQELSTGRAKQVFRYLRAFVERNEPVTLTLSDQIWSFTLREMPDYPTITVGTVTLSDSIGVTSPDEGVGEPLISVRRPKLTPPPTPPTSILDWLQGGWEQPDAPVPVLQTRNFRTGTETRTERFGDDPHRVAAMERWAAARQMWEIAERPARAAMRVFEHLYELRGRLQLEGERLELMLGDGRLQWRSPDGPIDHPVLLQRVELEFDPSVPELRITDSDRGPEFYGKLMLGPDGVSGETLNDLRLLLEEHGYHPLESEATNGFLRTVVQTMKHGTMLEAPANRPATKDPVILRDPVLFVRKRPSGLAAAFDRVLEDLERNGELPISLTRLVGVEHPVPPMATATDSSPWGEPEDILLSKPANAEQIQIAEALERHKAVLVQGPPGTGKSHTIANLIGHLVAQGKRVLVTSHTTKALRVLRDQVVEPLRPLCVSVLDTDVQSRTEMEAAVRGIISRLTLASEERLVHEADQIASARTSLNAAIRKCTGDLRVIRESEYVPIVIGGEPTPPSEAARWIRHNNEGNEWVPGPVELGAPLPVSSEEVRELYLTNGSLTTAEDGEMSGPLPDPVSLPDSHEFRELIALAGYREPAEVAPLWNRSVGDCDLDRLSPFLDRVRGAAAEFSVLTPWELAVVEAGYLGGAEREVWLNLAARIASAQKVWEEARPILLENHVAFESPGASNDLRPVVAAIREHLGDVRRLSLWDKVIHPGWKRVLVSFLVNGKSPTTPGDFSAIDHYLRQESSRRETQTIWERLAEPAGLPRMADHEVPPEPTLADYGVRFEPLLDRWGEVWGDVESKAGGAGFLWTEFRNREIGRAHARRPFERDLSLLTESLPPVVEHRVRAVRAKLADERLAALASALAQYQGPVCTAILASVELQNPDDYDRAIIQLKRLSAKRTIWELRQDVLKRMSPAAPAWADAIRRREGVHGASSPPGDASTAWRWRQFKQELDRRAALDEVATTRALRQHKVDLHKVTADLIDRRSWLAQLRRTDLRARQALQGWADTQKKIGRGTGKRAPELQAQSRKLLGEARNSVPVWIMPLSRVAESLDPTKGRFDVVIVDEASQCDVTGLLAWYMGERIAVVGDHEQVSPLAVGQSIDETSALIHQHLVGIPNAHLYDGSTSVYDLARESFGGTIALREHFRCVPAIIEFSNELSYNFEIRPLRNPNTAPRPHVIEYTTSDGVGREGKRNLAEAHALVAILKAMTELPEYNGRSMGAISLLGDEQAALISELAIKLVGAVELDRRQFVAGNSSQFQGDERSVILLSMVDSPVGGPLALRQAPLFKQRYNVAASRPRDQLWLVHSLNPETDLQSTDLRRRLIEYVRHPGARRRELQKAMARAESPFEIEVAARLIAHGYRVEPQVWAGSYRIDMVLSDGNSEVAIECDGDRFHGPDQIVHDMERQAILERAGWRFIRIRGSRFYRDPEAAMQWVFAELTNLGVQAVPAMDAAAPDSRGAELREQVIRRAAEIMRDQGWVRGVEGCGTV